MSHGLSSFVSTAVWVRVGAACAAPAVAPAAGGVGAPGGVPQAASAMGNAASQSLCMCVS